MHWHESIFDTFSFHILTHRRHSFYIEWGCKWDQEYKFYCRNLGHIWTEGTHNLQLSHFILSFWNWAPFLVENKASFSISMQFTDSNLQEEANLNQQLWNYNKIYRYAQWIGTSNLSLNVFRVDHRLFIFLFSVNAATWFIRWSLATWLLEKWC